MAARETPGARTRPTGSRWHHAALVLGITILTGALLAPVVLADHESTNSLVFGAVSEEQTAAGAGTIDFHGGAEPDSRWTSMFSFSGLTPATTYVVALKGRTGEDGSAAAAEFALICGFVSESDGTGGCWDYSLGMRRVGVVELREGSVSGPAVLRASRADGPGSIASTPNFFSPPGTASPPAPTAATPQSSPMASPAAAGTPDS